MSMIKRIPLLALSVALSGLVLPRVLDAQTGREIVEEAMRAQAERMEGVENYTIIQETMSPGLAEQAVADCRSTAAEAGLQVNPEDLCGDIGAKVYFERTRKDGRAVYQMVPPQELMRRSASESGYGTGQEQQGAGGIRSLQQRVLRTGTEAALEQVRDRSGNADDVVVVDPLAAELLVDRVKLEGRERLELGDGVYDTYILAVDDLSGIEWEAQATGGGEFTIESMTLYVDTEDYLTRRVVIAGTVRQGGDQTPLSIETTFEDYRNVKGMVHPFTTRVRSGGLMSALSDDDRRELEDALKQMKEAKKQLAELPPQYRKMAEERFKTETAKFEALVGGDTMETVIRVSKLLVNEGPPPEWVAPEGRPVGDEVEGDPQNPAVGRRPGT